MTPTALFVITAANLRMGRIWQNRQTLKEQKAGVHQGPVISDTMKAAAKARQRTQAPRRRQEKARAARARGRPPD